MLTESRQRVGRAQRARRLACLGVALLAGVLLSGCALGYLTQAADGQWRVLRERRPIKGVIDDPDTSASLRARLTLVRQARAFASSQLDLPDNRSYRTFSNIGRRYVVWDVVATPRFSLKPLRWCFPIAGCVSYRGYFSERAAHAFAATLAHRGDDVMVAGVTDYSTLGHFADPVLSSMLDYGNLDLVGTIFHELAHQLIYVPGDTQFDEAFAMTVEGEGLRRWLTARGRPGALRRYLRQQHDQYAILHVFARGRRALSRLYARRLPHAERLARKRRLMQQIGRQVLALERRRGVRSGYDKWIRAGLNNAYLASIATYYRCMPGFQHLLAREGDWLPGFYAAVSAMRHEAAARAALCRERRPAEDRGRPTRRATTTAARRRSAVVAVKTATTAWRVVLGSAALRCGSVRVSAPRR